MKTFILDLETTGFGNNAEIWQLGGLVVEAGKEIKVINEYSLPRNSSLTKRKSGKYDLNPQVKRVVGVGIDSIKILAKDRVEKDNIEIFEKYLDYTWIGHNIRSFDYRMIKNVYLRNGMEPPQVNIIDTMDLACFVGKNKRCKLSELYEAAVSMSDMTRTEIAEEYSELTEGYKLKAHDAVFDSFMVYFIIRELTPFYREYKKYLRENKLSLDTEVFIKFMKEEKGIIIRKR